MLADLGNLAIMTGFWVTVFVLVTYVVALVGKNDRLIKTAHTGVAIMAVIASLATAILVYLLVTGDFSVRYVVEHTNRALPVLYKISALWAGQEGSLLLWLWLHTILGVLVAFSEDKRNEELRPLASTIMTFIALFFYGIIAFLMNPFERMPVTYPDGAGLNPLLQNFGMIIHPVTLYLGYVGFAAPYAFAVANLFNKKPDPNWVKYTRSWVLAAWGFLSVGILYGAQWAYVELGWGGYWAWDPVENASLFPWLTGTALIHSALIHERRKALNATSLMLAIISYGLCVFGTYLTRSGVVQSVHGFPGIPLLNTLFVLFMAILVIVPLVWLYRRRDEYADEGQINEFFSSKEGTFVLTNYIFVGATLAILVGSLFPLISRTLMGNEITLNIGYYNVVNVPLGIALAFLLGACIRIAWKRQPGEPVFPTDFYYSLGATGVLVVVLYLMGVRHIGSALAIGSAFFIILNLILDISSHARIRHENTGEGGILNVIRSLTGNRRRFGAIIVHFAVALTMIGFAGAPFDVETSQAVRRGETWQVGNYELTYQGLREEFIHGYSAVYATVEVSRNGKPLGVMKPEMQFHRNYLNPSAPEQQMSEVAVRGNLAEDLYIILAGWERGGETATFKVMVNYLVNWIWIGMYLIAIGTVVALWPTKARVES
ncbi:MAG: heme lyase CcmF/NrfE family subunit [Firmicutes bacterium]|nr:heme lyase CcmF/NrfE family subunit [Bacillota bacterium]